MNANLDVIITNIGNPLSTLSMIARLRSKRVRSDPPVCLARSPGRRINLTDSARPKRTKSTPKISLDDYPHLAGLPLSPVTNAKVDLLIGQDQPDLLVPLEICRSVNKAGQLYATRSELGWALQGAVDDQIGCNACMMTNDIESETESTLSWSGEDETVYDMKQGKTERQCNMHQVVFPWRPGRL